MTDRMSIWIAVAGNSLVCAVTFAIRGWNAGSAHAAARNTARFSMLWFIVGFGAPGVTRLVRTLPTEARLIQAFLAAHVVHFATVSILIATFGLAHLWQNPGRVAAIVLGGFAVVVVAGLTATPRTSWLYTTVHKFTLYFVFLIFFFVFVHNAVKPLRFLVVPLGLALIFRLTSNMSLSKLRNKAVGQQVTRS